MFSGSPSARTLWNHGGTQDTYGGNVNAVRGQFEIFACCQPPPLLEDAGVRKSRRCAATIDTKDDRDSSK